MAIKKTKVEEVKEEVVKEEVVDEVKEEKAPKKEKKKTYIVKEPLNFREGPSTSDKIIKVLSVGTYVAVTKIENGWAECTIDGVNGYVMEQYITLK